MSAPAKELRQAAPAVGNGPLLVLPPELIPSVEHLVTEDDTPVDNIYSEKQQRLLARPLYSSWSGPPKDASFVAMGNVGMFFALGEPPLVPDFLLSVGVKPPPDLHQKRHRSYFFWEFGKPPDVFIEVVSNLEGEELGAKRDRCAQIGIPIYVVWDPFNLLGPNKLQVFGLRIKMYEPISPQGLPGLGLGLMLWHGVFEEVEDDWLRWTDASGQVIPLGQERAEQERQRAEQEHQRAEQEHQRAEEERQEKNEIKRQMEKLAAQLRKLGVEPETGET